ncbi:MAG TPA: SGNH/GDSL hydrolase family protein [Mesorhizobium sp.]
MKSVLCYGDSLTWGYDAQMLARHALQDRWPTVLQSALGAGFHVIAEGLNGRTTAFDDHLAGEDRNGARILPTVLGTHMPLDLVVIMLGSNDMKPWIHGNALAAAHGMKRLVQIVRGHPYFGNAPAPKVLLVSPPHVSRTDNAEFSAMFSGGNEASQKLAAAYSAVAAEMGCAFFDAATVARTTPLDGVHLDAENTRAIGAALAPIIRDLLKS